MPGIAGIFSHAPGAADDVQQMVACLLHEPGDRSDSLHHSIQGVHLAWADRPHSALSPTLGWNTQRDICLLLHGEDFSEAAATQGVDHLLARYESQGAAFVEGLNGSFVGVLVDLRQGTCLLFNDRYGASRLYWRQTPRALYFATEAKALLRLLADARALDLDAVAQSFSLGCVLQDRTLFKTLSLLPPASAWTFRGQASCDKRRYFTPALWEQQAELAPGDFYDQLKHSFATLLPRYLRGPADAAMSLTGGLDGRMIMAWAKCAPGGLPCYSFGGSYRDCHDVRLARQIAQHCRQPHYTIAVDHAFLAEFETLAPRSVYLSDGNMDVTGAVELYVNRLARDIAPIRITGNYGSEVLRSNVALRPRAWMSALFDDDFRGRLGSAAATYRAERAVHDLSFIAFKQVPWHHHARLSVEQSQLRVRSPFLDNALVRLMYQAPPAMTASAQPALRLIHDGDAALARLPTDRGLVYGATGLGQRLRHQLREFSAKAEYAYDYGMPQRLVGIDRVLAPLQPERLFLGRHKFYHFRTWYRTTLAPYVQAVLLDQRSLERSFFAPGVLQRLVKAHVSGRGNHTLEIHRALTLELLQRELLDRGSGGAARPESGG
jgi:asparagine synthase (glutamine-hydrolysing)